MLQTTDRQNLTQRVNKIQCGVYKPNNQAHEEKRWLNGLYQDQPEEWDDPYRFFRW